MDIPFSDIITHVNLTVDSDGLLVLCDSELGLITEEVSKWTQPTQRRAKKKAGQQRVNQQRADDDGIVRVVVGPQEQADTENTTRRSQRKRTVLLFNA